MAFPLMIFLNSTTIGLAPHVFYLMICTEIISHCIALIMMPFAVVCFANATLIHRNFRYSNILLTIHYAVVVCSRFVIIYYELNDIPVTQSDKVIFAADMIKDQFSGYYMSQFGTLSLERLIATHHWKWYERRGRSTLVILILVHLCSNVPSGINVVLCEFDYFPHVLNLLFFGVILFVSTLLFIHGYLENTRTLGVILNSDDYTISQTFQVKENIRVLKYLLLLVTASVPTVALGFSLFAVYFFLPDGWDRERYLAMELYDLCVAIYAPIHIYTAVTTMKEYHQQLYKIRLFKSIADRFCWRDPNSNGRVHPAPPKENETAAYFNQLSDAWA